MSEVVYMLLQLFFMLRLNADAAKGIYLFSSHFFVIIVGFFWYSAGC